MTDSVLIGNRYFVIGIWYHSIVESWYYLTNFADVCRRYYVIIFSEFKLI